MAVDANVLIYERILEEMRGGKGLKLAVNEGFKRALPSIIDGNFTTFLTGVILFIFGSGPIQGFATTLCIGILTSLFNSIFVTRLIIEWQLGKNKEVAFNSELSKNWLINPKADFMGMRKYFYAFSATVLLAGIISLSVRGLNYGVDFTGGHTYVVRFDNTVKTNEVQALLEKAFKTSPEVKTFGADNQVKITTKYMVNSNDPNVEQEIESKLYEGLKPLIKGDVTFEKFNTVYRQSSQKVGPTVANDIKTSAIWAIFFALIGIALYILIRFRNISFSLGGLISLAHDVLFTIGWFSILYSVMPFSMEIDQAFIAAILTIVGYSINDTVVIFDRVREYLSLGTNKHWDKKETYNRAMNVTLRRTLNTSLTVLITVVAIFIFGGEVLRGFIFALLIGIGVGTYSSIFVATCTVYEIDLWRERKAKKAEELKAGAV
jgi:SecD/SecF fusion protein